MILSRHLSLWTAWVAALALLVASNPVPAQTREAGPWWPNEEWGPDDQAGASNRITPDKVMDALSLATTGKIYELGQVYEQGMPVFPGRTYTLIIPHKFGPVGANQAIANDDYVATQIGQVGTQFDGLAHFGQAIEMADGETELVFYNGVTAGEMDNSLGVQKLGIEHVRPIITRGILVDVAGYKGVATLPAGYEVTLADVRASLERTGISDDDIEPGDAVFFRYGWSELWTDPERYNGGPPGIGLEVARWVAEKKVTMVGSDAWPTEVVPNPDPELVFPVHQELMMKNGIFNLENMRYDDLIADEVYEFLFVFTPIRFKGATGSPGRPIGIR